MSSGGLKIEDVDAFHEYRQDDFLIGVVPSSDSALDEFLGSLGIPKDELEPDPDHKKIQTYTVDYDSVIREPVPPQDSGESSEREESKRKIGFVFSSPVDSDIKGGKQTLQGLAKWLKKSFKPDQANFDALFYLRSVTDVPMARAPFRPGSYTDLFAQLCRDGTGECINLMRLRLVLTDFLEGTKLEPFKEFWSCLSGCASVVEHIYPRDRENDCTRPWSYIKSVVDNVVLEGKRKIVEKGKKVDGKMPSLKSLQLKEAWKDCKRFLGLLRSENNTEGIFRSVRNAFEKFGKLSEFDELGVGRQFISFFTDGPKQLIARAFKKCVFVYRLCLIDLAGRGVISVKHTDFYGKTIKGDRKAIEYHRHSSWSESTLADEISSCSL